MKTREVVTERRLTTRAVAVINSTFALTGAFVT